VINRKNRFHGHRSVSRVRGSLDHYPTLSVRYAKNKKSDYRLAVVVSRKISKLAVVRNRIRRRIYETFRTQERLKGLGIDMVIYVKTSDVAEMPTKDLSDQILKLTKKAISSLH